MDLSDWLKVMEQIAKDKYEGKLKDGDLSDEYIHKTYNELNGAFKNGFDSSNYEVHGATNGISPETLKMKQNLFKFSGAKTYVMLEEVNQILTSEKGNNWNTFKNEVLKLNPKYNKNYLQAEWQTAKQAGYHAANWDEYQRNKDLFPNLKYMTQKDERVREPHRLLHGIIAPLNSDFWKTHYPPNGWRCRCYVVQTAEPPTKDDDIPNLNEKEFPKEFRVNVGISGEVFKETDENKGKAHPYFALFKGAGSETKKAYEYSKLAAAKELAYTAKNGAKIKVSPFADPSDFEENFIDAKRMADQLKYNVDIEAHLDGEIIKNHRNPEYKINGAIADRKAPENANTKNLLRKAQKQGCEIVVLNIGNSKANEQEILKDLQSRFRFDTNFPNIKEVILIDKNGKCKKYNREDFKKKKTV